MDPEQKRLACQCGEGKFHVTRKRNDAGLPDCRVAKRRPPHWKQSWSRLLPVKDEIGESDAVGPAPDPGHPSGTAVDFARAPCDELEQLKDENARLQTECDNMSVRIASLIQASGAELVQLKDELVQLKDENARLRMECKDADIRIAALLSALATANDKISVLQREPGQRLPW